jgi:HEAT repeat protein
MTPRDLARWIAKTPGKVIPFVGAGMTLPAGAPDANALAAALGGRFSLDPSAHDCGLPAVTRQASEAHGVRAVQEQLAAIITGLRLHLTPALTALAGTQARRILTTNYDDGLERAAAARGISATSLLASDPRMLDEPEPGELHVIHLHGVPGKPESLVLPGKTTNALDDDEVFTTFVRATMAHRSVVFLGFSLAMTEVHVHHVLRWLSGKVAGAPTHHLLLAADEIAARPADMEAVAGYGNVTVVPYPTDAAHSAVERVALSLAPRAGNSAGDRERLTWVQPPLLRVAADDDPERVQQRIAGIEGGWGDPADLHEPQDLLAERRCLVIGAPGMGKTTLLERLARTGQRTTAIAKLRHFQPSAKGVPRGRAVHRLLMGLDGEPLALEVLQGNDAVLLLDGLDEVREDERQAAVEAVIAAGQAWSGHTWIVTSRPGAAAAALADNGFLTYRIPLSRAWARTYLQTRSVPSDRIARAMLDGYGLGDLLSIPLFAERLADRLLDELDASTGPLDLLVDEQYAATRREAKRHGYPADELATWLRSLAVGLELRGRSAATVDELKTVPGPSPSEEVRGALVEATLLADVPGSAEFPAKTLQEGLCADAILKCRDPVATLRHVATATVEGYEWLRSDLDFTLDLVFEHCDGATRKRLKDLDPGRWARTVATRGTAADAAEAFDIIWDWHADHGLRFGWGGESGLRTSREAVAEIVRRWPAAIEARLDELVSQLDSPDESARSRALSVLSLLQDDERVVGWVLRGLSDERSRIIAEAAAAAGRLRLNGAHGELLELLDDPEERVRRAALQALIEIADTDELPVIAGRVRGNGLRGVAPRLLERLDLDTGMALVATGTGMDEVRAWMLDRLVETAHPDAWSAERVRRLMQCCDVVGGIGEPDLDRVAQVLRRHPDAAISAIRLRPLEGRPWGSRLALLALRRVGPQVVEDDEHADLRVAMERAVAEDAEIRQRQQSHERWRTRLAALLDEQGVDIDPGELEPPLMRRDIDERHRDLLLELVERWWPPGPLDKLDDEGWVPIQTRVMLNVGAALEAPLPRDRWLALLDAHLRAPRHHPELSGDAVASWLARTYTPDDERAIVERIAEAPHGEVLSKLIAISGARPHAAAVARLRKIGPEASWWLNAAGLLCERGAVDEVRTLLNDDLPPKVRAGLLERLATYGDEEAQLEVIRGLTQRVEAGDAPDGVHWWVRTPVDVAALHQLADAAIRHDANETLNFAVGLLAERADVEALRTFDALAATHGRQRRWLRLQAVSLARRIATQRVLARLPSDLGELVAHVEAISVALGRP